MENKKVHIKTNSKEVMPIMEIFGPTIQGEGMVVGQKTIFLRTGGCDYHCSWCDSAFTWDGSTEPTYMTPEEAYDKVIDLSLNEKGERICNHMTLTGGNPALVNEPMARLLEMLKAAGFKISIETQGTIYREWFKLIDHFVLSPKPPSSKMRTNMRLLDRIVAQLIEDEVNFTFKIVIFDDEDLAYAKELFKHYPEAPKPYYLSVGNIDALEQGDVSGRLIQKLGWLWDKVFDDPELNDARPLPQLHTLVYSNKRGV